MKVVQINAVCGTGSTGRICTNLADALIAGGHECKILYGNGTSTYPHGINISNKWLVKLNAFRARITGNDMGGCFISTWRIIRFLKKYKPDVVHLHNLHSHFVNLPILCQYLAKNNIPTVITLHDCWFFTGGCTHYTVAQCNRWQKDCTRCPGYANGINSWFFNKSASSIEKKRKALHQIPRLHIVGCSQWIVNEAKQSIKSKKFHRIYNGIKQDQFFPSLSDFRQKHNAENCDLILGFANKWLHPINKSILIGTLSTLNIKQRLVIIGCSKKQIDFLSSFKKKIIALPYIYDIRHLREIYSTCTIFVNLSHEDTLPTVNLEAQACGLPILAHNKTGIRETICPETGEVVSEITASNIQDFLTKILQKNRDTITKVNLKYIRKRFTFDSFLRNHIKMYENITNT